VDPVKITSERANAHRLNLYAYAACNPTKFVDPDGKEVEFAIRRVSPFDFGPYGEYHAFLAVNGETLSGFPVDGMLKGRKGKDELGEALMTTRLKQPSGMSEEEFDAAVLAAFEAYGNDLPYHPLGIGYHVIQLGPRMPPVGFGGYNSNSFVAGILLAAGMDPADVDRLGRGRVTYGTSYYLYGWKTPIPLRRIARSESRMFQEASPWATQGAALTVRVSSTNWLQSYLATQRGWAVITH
jgi:hypothetical protein